MWDELALIQYPEHAQTYTESLWLTNKGRHINVNMLSTDQEEAELAYHMTGLASTHAVFP